MNSDRYTYKPCKFGMHWRRILLADKDLKDEDILSPDVARFDSEMLRRIFWLCVFVSLQ